MTNNCSICGHPQRTDIERDYVTNHLPLTKLSQKYGVSYWTLRTHMQEHLPDQLVEAAREKEMQGSDIVLNDIHALVQSAQNQLSRAERKGHSRVALESIKTLKDLYQLLLQIQIKLRELELEQGNQQLFNSDSEKQVEEMHNRLNEPELDMYFQLLSKMMGNTNKVIIPDEDTQEETPTYRGILKRTKKTTFKHQATDNDQTKEAPLNRIQPIKDTQIPGR